MKGRFFLAAHLPGGSPSRLEPLLHRGLAEATESLGLPPAVLACESAAGGKRLCRGTLALEPGVSTIQANARITTQLLDLGARLVSGTETPDRDVHLLFAAGPKLTMDLLLHPPPISGPDTVITPGPGFPAVQVKVRLALLIEDYGADPVQSRRFAALPGTFTASIRPNIVRPRRWTDEALRNRMEVILSLPMEPRDYPTRNPGPGSVLVDLSGREIRGRVGTALNRVGPVSGVLTFMGQLAVEDRDVMRAVLEECKEKGLFFIDATQSPYTTAPDLAREIGVPFYAAGTTSLVDGNERSVAGVRIRFDDLIEQSRRRGYGVGIVHAREATLTLLEERLPELAREGVVVMGISDVLRQDAIH